MSNLLKRGSTVSKEERVIDYNDLIRIKLQSAIDAASSQGDLDADGFIQGLTADVVEELVSDSEDIGAIDALVQDSVPSVDLDEINQQAKQILDDANEQARLILEQADAQAAAEAANARDAGYQEGIGMAQAELDNMRSSLMEEYNNKLSQLEAEYNDSFNNMEAQLIEVITEVFKSVVVTDALDNKDIIMHLIGDALKEADRTSNYLIRVSPEDYDYVSANQGKLYCGVAKELDVEIAEDSSLEANQCIIESNGSVINCSLDVELKNLIDKLKLLSCMA